MGRCMVWGREARSRLEGRIQVIITRDMMAMGMQMRRGIGIMKLVEGR